MLSARSQSDAGLSPPGDGARRVAEAVVAFESRASQAGDDPLDAAEHIIGGLQDELVVLVGITGYNALLDRSVKRAAAERGMAVRGWPPRHADAPARAFRDDINSLPTDDVHGALVAVLAELLGLLARLIGGDLSVRLVQRTWPDVVPWLTAAHLEDADV
jgi:hypothetical protein